MDGESELEQKTRCLHQVFRPESETKIKPEGWGDCYKCTYDKEENPKCAGYFPITVTYCHVCGGEYE